MPVGQIQRWRSSVSARRSVPSDPEARERLAEIEALERAHLAKPKRNARINGHLRRHLAAAELAGGDALEIGARDHPRTGVFAPGSWNYSVMDIAAVGRVPDGVALLIGDITACPEVAAESFDAIVSVDVFEHVRRPWLAAEEITRLLRPGGVSYTSTLFAWRYHPVPVDYWRFTPECLEFLFSGLDTVECAFDTIERRRDLRGHGRADRVELDALGGFRENWRVTHVGRKPG